MKISVLVTTHNRPAYLRKVLAGYLDQTRLPDELIVADDGSGASTRAVVDRFTRAAPFRVVHTWQPHAGTPRCSHVRNLGTRAATGDYLIYTDGDCVPTRNFVADHARLARPKWFVQGKRMWVKYKALHGFTGREPLVAKLRLWADGALTKPHWLMHLPGIGRENHTIEHIQSCNMAVFHDDVDAVNGWNEAFLGFWRQDTEFALRLMRSGLRRRDAMFSAIVYHLEHDKPLVRADMERNNRLLAAAHAAPIFTPLGLHPTFEDRRKAA